MWAMEILKRLYHQTHENKQNKELEAVRGVGSLVGRLQVLLAIFASVPELRPEVSGCVFAPTSRSSGVSAAPRSEGAQRQAHDKAGVCCGDRRKAGARQA